MIQNSSNIKSELGAKKESDQSKDFLFDPYAAAYYARFTDYDPCKQSLTQFMVLTTADKASICKEQPNLQVDLQQLKMTHYYQEYC